MKNLHTQNLTFIGLPTAKVRVLQTGGPDAYGNAPEVKISGGDGVPCRHCLKMVEKDDAYLVLAHRPFSSVQPYAETGPIFIHQKQCDSAVASAALPEIIQSPDYIVRGYDADERIVYGTGAVIHRETIVTRAQELFAQPRIAFVDVRSARNNCFQCRIVSAA